MLDELRPVAFAIAYRMLGSVSSRWAFIVSPNF
jgi:hypothetical protein